MVDDLIAVPKQRKVQRTTTRATNYFKLSRWLLLIRQQYNRLNDLLEIGVNELTDEFNRLHTQSTQPQHTNHFIDLNHGQHTYRLMKKSKTQCKALKSDNKTRCTNMTLNDNGLCHVHVNKEAQDWDDEATPTQTATTQCDDEPTLPIQPKLPANKLLLRKSKNGLIYWPNTNLVVKSFKEPYVFAKDCIGIKNELDPLHPLDENDISYCESYKIPYKLTYMKFAGDNKVPKYVIEHELKKILAPAYTDEEGLEF